MLATDAAVVRAVREQLDDAGYTPSAVSELLHLPGELRITPGDATRAGFLLDADRPLDALVRLFLLDGVAAEASTARALGEGLDLLRRAGLVAIDRGTVRATSLLVPHDALIVASDRFGPADRWWVPGVQRPSDLLACVTPRRDVARALDLGTGNGIQALLLSEHCDRVIAVDVNPHALEMARFNALLNGRAERIELRLGNFVEPVADEEFDLIVSNPPYVLSPERSYVFRDAEVRGDVMCRELLEAVAARLTNDGLAVVMVSWPDHGDDAPAPRRWLEDAGADGVLVVLGVHGALDTAMLWNAAHLGDPDEFVSHVESWRDYFATEDIPSIGHGVVAMRRAPSGRPPATSVLPVTGPPGPGGGAQLARIVEAIGSGATAETSMLAMPPDVQLTQTWRPAPGGLESAGTELSAPGGLAFSVGLDPAGAGLVGRFATATRVQRALDDVADLAPDARGRAIGFLGHLVGLGLLAIADP